mgnify:CR=1 FL=1|jgi:hypothetical protein|tara:strand:+ start:476 stop:862 length:387 start_codon:yes stop_codon:yes gene_type:complete
MTNKHKGIVKNISMKTKGILIINKDLSEEWWNPLSDKAKELITPDLKGNEVELTIINQEKRSFSYLVVLKQNVSEVSGGCVREGSEESRRYRAMSVAYAKDGWVADKIEKDEVMKMAQSIFLFIMNGE